MKPYNPSEIEKKWQKHWEAEKLYQPDIERATEPFYNLWMFPYPSAEGLHVGHAFSSTGSDIYGRFMRMNKKDVFQPIGYDSFGIHSENYAMKIGEHPQRMISNTTKRYEGQLKSLGHGYDWSRTVLTSDIGYYKWTQWLFIQLFKAGLAYKKKAPVNFCPKDLTVLADEQVIDGKCERDGAIVEKRELEQWFFKITDYAERLLNNIPELNWSEKVKVAQRNWIGKSEGARIAFRLQTTDYGKKAVDSSQLPVDYIEVFTTRPDTLFGATFLVISPELAQKWLEVGWQANEEVTQYIKKSLETSETDRIKEGKEKTGVFTGIHAINPANQASIPVWVADFVIGSYGTGAVFADAHDERDFEFAKKHKIPLRPTLKTGNKEKDARIYNLKECFTGDGILTDSEQFSGMTSAEARKKIVEWLQKKDDAKPQVNYHLRDWLISRQRYWGPPIPMIFCQSCADKRKNWLTLASQGQALQGSSADDTAGWFPVPEADLPVVLPELADFKPKGNGKSPLANIKSFVNTKCPNCGSSAKRETDVSDTFLDSAWYFYRYACTDIESSAFDRERVKKWLPVKMYIGGAEHSVLHLLYSRFIALVLADLKFTNFEEPFARFYAHGLIIKDGAKMSKSRGNVIVPDQYIAKFGADTLRMYLMFLGPFSAGGDFRDSGIEGMNRFLRRVWTLLEKSQISNAKGQNIELDRIMNKTIKKVTEEVENLRYNTAIAGLMEWYNFLAKQEKVSRQEAEIFLKLIAPFAPHLTEELWSEFGNKKSIHLESWPTYDERLLQEEEVNIAISINGKTRDVIKVSKDSDQQTVEKIAKESDNLKKYLEGKTIVKIIYVPGKIINFVLN